MIRPHYLLPLTLLAPPALAGDSIVGGPDGEKAPTISVHTVTGLNAMDFPGTGYSLTQTALWGYHALDWKRVVSPSNVIHHPPHWDGNVNSVEDVPDAGAVGVHCQHATDLDFMEDHSGSFAPFLYEDVSTQPYFPAGDWACPQTPSPIETVAIAILGIDRWGSPTYFDYIIPTATGSTTVAMIESVTISTPPNMPTLTQACNIQGGNINQLIDDFVACSYTVPWTIDSMTVRLWTRQSVNGQFTWTQTMTPAAFLAGYLDTQNTLTQYGQSTIIQHVVDPDEEEVSPDDIVLLSNALAGALHAKTLDGTVVPLAELPPTEVPEGVPTELEP